MATEKQLPLAGRGWTLQEVLLSLRILYLRPYRMYFKCNTSSQFEDFPHRDELSIQRVSELLVGRELLTIGPLTLYCSISKSEVMPAASTEDKRRSVIWNKIVREYSRRSLAVPRDKLPGLSGIANWLLGSSEGYLAGLLATDIHSGLAWFVDTKRSDIQKEGEHDEGHNPFGEVTAGVLWGAVCLCRMLALGSGVDCSGCAALGPKRFCLSWRDC